MDGCAPIPRWTVEQRLDPERSSDVRHEYIDGIIDALAGGMLAHSAVTANGIVTLHSVTRGGPCRVYSSDMAESDRCLVEVHNRGEHGRWLVWRFAAGAVVDLPSLGVQVAVDPIEAGVTVDETP